VAARSSPLARALAGPALAALALLLASPASASPGQRTLFEDPTLLLRSGPETRAHTLDELSALGVDTVRLRAEWRALAPDPTAETRPALDARDPVAYPPSAWTDLDDAVRGVTARGMRVFLMLSPPAPEWATEQGEREGHVGVFRPDPSEFGAWVEAVGRRYAGDSPGLPRVATWSLWNEPNHPQFLQPLSERLGGRMTPSAPHHYRRLYVAGRAALARSGHARDAVLMGEVLPVGEGLSATDNLSPILFLREFFCVDERYRPYRGRAARLRGCGRFPRIATSGLAYHPYTRTGGPREAPPSRDDATIGQLQRVERALDRIARTGRVARRLPVHATEFGVESVPDCRRGETLADQAAFVNEAEYISWTRARVKSYGNYLLVDEPIAASFPPRSKRRNRGFQSGLRFGPQASGCEGVGRAFAAGSPKPAYDAFRTPLYVRRLGARLVQVFGRARPRGRSPQRIAILRNGRTVARVTARGYFLARLARPARGRWRLRWTWEGETHTSREARALADPRP
jgi:hypothetical protein